LSPIKEFKGRPEAATWNVLYYTSFRNYAAISLQVPSILSILLALNTKCKFYAEPCLARSKKKKPVWLAILEKGSSLKVIEEARGQCSIGKIYY